MILNFVCHTERGVILSCNIPDWFTHEEAFCTIEWGDQAEYVAHTYITSPGWVVVAVLMNVTLSVSAALVLI
jgi:hypothetical protein